MITTLIAIVNTLTDTGVNDYPANYKITDKDHVHVFYVDGEEVEVELVQVSSFTAGDDNEYKVNAITESGFNVELRDTYDAADNRKISIRRIVPFTQEVEYPPGNDFPGSTHERALDKLTAIIQQFNEEIKRTIGLPLSEDAEDLSLPAYISNYYLGLDGDNNLKWKAGTVAVANNEINDSHIDWGTNSEQVSAVDMPIADAGSLITGENVETALQEIASKWLKPSTIDILSSNQGVTLPAITGNPQIFSIYWSGGDGTYKLTLTADDSETLDGLAASIWKGEGEGLIVLESDGTNWKVLQYEDYMNLTTGTQKIYKTRDGAEEQIITATLAGAITTAVGDLFVASITPGITRTHTLVSVFSEIATVLSANTNKNIWIACDLATLSVTETMSFSLMSPISIGGTPDYDLSFTAKGRWRT